MDHSYIAEHSLIERYSRGLLEPAEEALFEEHFFGCPECTAEIELARSFGRGMKALAAITAEEAVQAAVVTGLFAWLARRGRLAQWGLALAALLVAAGIPAAWMAVRAEQGANAVAAYRRQLDGERQKAAALGERLQASERGRTEERQKLEARLAAAQKAQAVHPAPWNEILFNTPVFLLRTFRDAPAAAPATLQLPPGGGAVSLAVDAPVNPRFTSYRVRLTGAGGRSVFEKADLHPNSLEALLITFPPGFFAPGAYQLSVEGMAPDGKVTPLGSHPFRVVAARR